MRSHEDKGARPAPFGAERLPRFVLIRQLPDVAEQERRRDLLGTCWITPDRSDIEHLTRAEGDDQVVAGIAIPMVDEAHGVRRDRPIGSGRFAGPTSASAKHSCEKEPQDPHSVAPTCGRDLVQFRDRGTLFKLERVGDAPAPEFIPTGSQTWAPDADGLVGRRARAAQGGPGARSGPSGPPQT